MNSRTRVRATAVALALLVATAASACGAVAEARMADKGQAAAAAATSQMGVPYVYGGASPAAGFDCSGLTSWAWARAGKTIPRTATDQFHAATRVTRANLEPGDLVFYGYGGNIQHVGIYVGDGYMVDSPKPGTSVEKVNVDQWWTDALVGYGRVTG